MKKQLIPAKFRPDAAVVPVVRLSGVIGAVTPLRPMALPELNRQGSSGPSW